MQRPASPLGANRQAELDKTKALRHSAGQKRGMGMLALVNHLIQLRDGIVALRKEREDFLANLELESSNRRAAVANLLSGFSSTLDAMARQSRAERSAFVSNLQQEVADLRGAVRADIRGGRLAFERLRSVLTAHALPAPGPSRQAPGMAISETPPIPKSSLRGGQTHETGGRAQAAETGKRKSATRKKRQK